MMAIYTMVFISRRIFDMHIFPHIIDEYIELLSAYDGRTSLECARYHLLYEIAEVDSHSAQALHLLSAPPRRLFRCGAREFLFCFRQFQLSSSVVDRLIQDSQSLYTGRQSACRVYQRFIRRRRSEVASLQYMSFMMSWKRLYLRHRLVMLDSRAVSIRLPLLTFSLIAACHEITC